MAQKRTVPPPFRLNRRRTARRRRESRAQIERADAVNGNARKGTAAAFVLLFSLQHSALSTRSGFLFLLLTNSFPPPTISSPSRSNRSSTFPLLTRMREPFSPSGQVYEASIRKADTLFLAGKMEPNMRVLQPTDKDYLSTVQQLEEYLLQKYIQKRAFRKSE